MAKTIFNPMTGSYSIEGHEHLHSYTDRKSAREAYRKFKEHEQSHWGDGNGSKNGDVK